MTTNLDASSTVIPFCLKELPRDVKAWTPLMGDGRASALFRSSGHTFPVGPQPQLIDHHVTLRYAEDDSVLQDARPAASGHNIPLKPALAGRQFVLANFEQLGTGDGAACSTRIAGLQHDQVRRVGPE